MKEDICMIYTEGLPELPGNRFEINLIISSSENLNYLGLVYLVETILSKQLWVDKKKYGADIDTQHFTVKAF